MANKKTTLEDLLSVFQKEKTFKKEKEKISFYVYEGYKIVFKLYNPSSEEPYDYILNEKGEALGPPSPYFESKISGNIILAFLNIIETLKEHLIPLSSLKNSEISILKVTYIIYKNKKIYLETEELYKKEVDKKEDEENIKIVNDALSDLSKIGNSYDEILYKLYKYVMDKNLKE